MNVKKTPLSALRLNDGNPRIIKDHKFQKLVKSILTFPEMLRLREIVADETMSVLGGNMRLRAMLHIAQMTEQELSQMLRQYGAERHTDYWLAWHDKPMAEVKVAEGLTDEQKKEFIVKDNVGYGEWDWDMLANEWDVEELSDWGVDLPIDWGNGVDRENADHTAEEDDFDENEVTESVVKAGEIWQLGRHRLMCGDSTSESDVARLMDGKKADMVFTDPPYGMKKESEGVMNDNLNYDDLLEFNKKWIPLTFANTKENGSWYCWGIDEPLMDIYSHILKPMQRENKITFRNFITWKKENDNPTMLFNGACSSNNRSYYANEKCLFVMCGMQGFNNNSDNYFEEYEPIRSYLEQEAKKASINAKNIKQICGVGMYAHWFTKSQWDLMTEEHYKKIQNYCIEKGINAFGKQYDEIKKQYDEIKKQWYETRAYFDGTASQCIDVWVHDVTSIKERELCGGHATLKPIALCSRAIKSSSRENESILDLFGGSGSTLIAAEQLDRTCYMMELNPHYCDVIIARWEKLTGNKATKIERQ